MSEMENRQTVQHQRQILSRPEGLKTDLERLRLIHDLMEERRAYRYQWIADRNEEAVSYIEAN